MEILGTEHKQLKDNEIIALFKKYEPVGNCIGVVAPMLPKGVIALGEAEETNRKNKIMKEKGALVVSMGSDAMSRSNIKTGDNVLMKPHAMPMLGMSEKGYDLIIMDVSDICIKLNK